MAEKASAEKAPSGVALKKGIFCFSFDFEMAWGNFDRYDRAALEKKARLTREKVLPKIQGMLRGNGISATWAVVGHLFLGSCDGEHGQPAPVHAWLPDWYRYDPKGTEEEHPEWYARSFVRDLMALEPKQDIGLHGFSHCIWGDAGCDRDVARMEMKNALSAAGEIGIRPESFVFPRNSIGHLDILSSAGIRVFRDREENGYRGYHPLIRRACHFLSQFAGLAPRTVYPRIRAGMVCIPSSSLYMSMEGFRRCIPVSARVRRALKGMRRAAAEKNIFHLITHPIYLAYEDGRTDDLLEGLDRIFGWARGLRERGALDILNMAQIAGLLQVGRGRCMGAGRGHA